TPERVRKAEASRQTSEVGAVCRKAARTVLCGGRPVMDVPTAIASSSRLEAEILLLQGAHRRWMAQHGCSSVGLSEPLPENGAKPGFSRRFAMRRARSEE